MSCLGLCEVEGGFVVRDGRCGEGMEGPTAMPGWGCEVSSSMPAQGR